MSELLIAVFGDTTFTVGFELAGIRTIINTADATPEKRIDLLFETMKRKDIGILIVDEESIAGISNQDRLHVENCIKPVILLLSNKKTDENSLRKQIIRAIGVDVYK